MPTAATGYRFYGGGPDDYVYPLVSGVQVEVWDALEGGSRVTDLLDVSGNAVANARPVSLDGGYGPLDVGLMYFQAPQESPLTLYLDRDNGASRRVPIAAQDVWQKVAQAISTAEQASADVSAYGPTAQAVVAQAQDAYDIATATQAQQDQIAGTFQLQEATYNVATVRDTSDAVNGGISLPAFPVMYDQTIDELTLWFSADVASSNTDYWTFDLYVWRGGVKDGSPLVSKNTKASGGENIASHAPWGLTGSGIDQALNTLTSGDRVVIELTKTGSPANLVAPIQVGWR